MDATPQPVVVGSDTEPLHQVQPCRHRRAWPLTATAGDGDLLKHGEAAPQPRHEQDTTDSSQSTIGPVADSPSACPTRHQMPLRCHLTPHQASAAEAGL